MAWGYRAMFVLLYTYQKRYGERTLRQLISRYAPPIENQTDKYIATVSKSTGIGPDIPIDTTFRKIMIPVVSAMSRVENGIAAHPAEVEEGWQLFVTHRP